MISTPRQIMPKPNPPCKDCPDRVIGCHSTCEKYKAYNVEREKLWYQIRDSRMKEKQVDDFRITATTKSCGEKPPQR